MKLTKGMLLSAVIGTTYANSEPAAVYIYQGAKSPSSATPPMITPEEARLILAQRLRVPQYHSLENVDSIPYINSFGGLSELEVAELVLIVEGVSLKTAVPFADPFLSLEPTFKISNPPSSTWTRKLVDDFQEQVGPAKEKCAFADDINPLISECWSGKSKIIRVDLADQSQTIQELEVAKDKLIKYAKDSRMNVVMVFMPETCRLHNTYSNPYGSYDMPSQVHLGRRGQAEEPMTEPTSELSTASTTPTAPTTQYKAVVFNSSAEPIVGVPTVCHTSKDFCTNSTNSCSGHGKCIIKSGIEGDNASPACWACMCESETKTVYVGDAKQKAYITTYYGGAACQKQDISSPFWLLLVVSLALVGVVAWGISLLFSIGEEKLPGVIGAGVSSKSR